MNVSVVFVCLTPQSKFLCLSTFSRDKSYSNVYLLLAWKFENKEFKVVKFCQHLLSFQLSRGLLRLHMNAKVKK